MLLIKNMFLQQTSQTFFVLTLSGILFFILIIYIVLKKQSKKKSNNLKDNNNNIKTNNKQDNTIQKMEGEIKSHNDSNKENSFNVEKNNYSDSFLNLLEVTEYFMNNHKNGAYNFEDEYSGWWVQFASPFGTYYVVETSLLDDNGKLINDKEVIHNSEIVFNDCDLIDEGLFSKKISDKPIEGLIFLFKTFYQMIFH